MDEAAIKTAGPRNLVDKMKPLGGSVHTLYLKYILTYIYIYIYV